MGYRTIITPFHYFHFERTSLQAFERTSFLALIKIQFIPIRYQVSVLPYILAIEPSCRRDTFKMLLKDFSDELLIILIKRNTFVFYCTYDF